MVTSELLLNQVKKVVSEPLRNVSAQSNKAIKYSTKLVLHRQEWKPLDPKLKSVLPVHIDMKEALILFQHRELHPVP